MTDPRSPLDDRQPAASDAEQHKLLAHIDGKTLFFGAVAIVAVVLFAIAYLDGFTEFINSMGAILSPVIIGCVIAYLCDPILKIYERRVLRRMKKGGLRRGLSLLLTVLTVLAAIALILLLIVPELINSIQSLVDNYEFYVNSVLSFINGILGSLTANLSIDIDISDIEKLGALLTDVFGSGEELMKRILSWISGWATAGTVGGMLMDVFNAFKNLLLGIFIAFYILASKEKRVAQIRKFRKAVLTDRQDARVTELTRLVDHTFSGFLFGVLMDALVVGVLTFLLLTIFSVSPYNLLIATFVAVTNIIPVFGPFIGAIPSAFIVLISNPSKLILFIVLILIIQQLDGNVLCPKIQSDNTGVSSLAVLVAITVAGSLWGIVGMVIGVPIFAVIIELFKRAIEHRLVAKGMPTETEHYYPRDALGNAERDLHYEHAGLRYAYDHSKLKARLDRIRADRKKLRSDIEKPRHKKRKRKK